MKLQQKGKLYFIAVVLLLLLCLGCVEGYDYQINFYNHTPGALLIFIKESYPDTTLEKADLETIIYNASRNDSSWFYSEIIDPNSKRIIAPFYYRNAWPYKGEKTPLTIFVFDKRQLTLAKGASLEEVKKAQLRTLLLSFDEVRKNGFRVDYY